MSGAAAGGVGRAKRRGRMTASEATPISQGTRRAKAGAGVAKRRSPPAAPPAMAKGMRRRTAGPCPLSSGRNPQTDPALLNTSETVLVTLALTGESPAASNAG